MPRQRPSFYYHLHPPTIPAREARFWYTFGLGGISLLLFLVLGLTGIIEMFIYVPTPEGAYESVQQITHLAPFGWLIRNVHFWGAQMMVGTVVLHMVRVVLSGGYKGRRLNWLIGIALLVLTLVLDFSGYVLRWDQDTGWALLIGANLIKAIPGIGSGLYRLLIGGKSIGGPALIRFFTWHVVGLDALALGIIAWHLFRVRRDGGISSRAREPRVGREELVRTELTAAGLALAALVAISLVFDAPLGPPADPTALVVEPRAPWFFIWIQELLRVASPLVAGVLVPLAVLLVVSALPYTVDRSDAGVGEWFNRPGRVAQGITLMVVVVLTFLTLRNLLR